MSLPHPELSLLRISIALLLANLLGAAACSRQATSPAPQSAVNPRSDRSEARTDPPLFRDMTSLSGLDFTPRNGEEANQYAILETLGSGVALLDYDGDGLLDVFVCGGGYFKGQQICGYPNRLYKNLGNWRFRDVTAEVGLDAPVFYSHGCAVADYDRDGRPDLLVTGYGRLVLYHNVSDGKGGRRFVDVTDQAMLHDRLWSTSAAWGDLDGDGYPDLYVCHYLDWSFANNPACAGPGGVVPREVCTPSSFAAQPHVLYHNNGNGTFTDISKQAGLRHLTADDGKGLGVLIADLNDDRRPDIFVVNDTTDNLLYWNRGRGLFEERGLQAGVARDDQGQANGSMGVDAGDYDGSGRPSLWITNFEEQLHSLFRNRSTAGAERFTYHSQAAGIARLGRHYVGWGTGFLDFDNDGWEDLVVSNGHVFRHAQGGMGQRPVLLRNVAHASTPGERWFTEVTDQGGGYFQGRHRGRGLAVGDLDNDGYPDLVISHVNEPIRVFRNESRSGHHWLGVSLVGAGHADVVGAKVTLEVAGRRLTRFSKGGGSYLSSSDRRLLFGLATGNEAGRLTVSWPSGRTEHWDGLAIDRYHRLEETRGIGDTPEVKSGRQVK